MDGGDDAVVEVVATEAHSDDDKIKLVDLQNMVTRLTEELEALRLKHREDDAVGEAKAVEVTDVEQVAVSVRDQSNTAAAEEKNEAIENEYTSKTLTN